MPRSRKLTLVVCALSAAVSALGCNAAPDTNVVLDNKYPTSASPLVVYDAYWEAVSFRDAAPIAPGSSSTAQPTVPCSPSTAYVVLAPGWDPASATRPTSLLVLQSREGFGVDLGDTLDLPVNDTTFLGNCAAGSFLTQAQADFITQQVFANDFAALRYNASTCQTTPVADGGAP